MVDLRIDIPDGFLEEEERCGHIVSKQMKEVWAIQLDLLAEFDRVCNKHNIKYFASGGTALGAIRHKGFIPWDDDMDLMMLRDDYDKLLEIAPDEFKPPYFLQNKFSDPEANETISKLRNIETTALLKDEIGSCFNYCKGIFIDIFPLDVIPDNLLEQDSYFKDLKNQRDLFYKKGRSIGIFSDSTNKLERLIKHFLYWILSRKRKTRVKEYQEEYRKYVNLCRRFNHQSSKRLMCLEFTFDINDYKCTADLQETIYVDFEFTKIPIGANYHHGLITKYGNDYMIFKKCASMHSEIFFDTEKSYKNYLLK